MTRPHNKGEGPENDRTDWERVKARSDAEIAEAIRNDPDAIDPGEEWLRSAQPKSVDGRRMVLADHAIER